MITMIKGAHFVMCCYMCVMAAVPVTVVITMIKGVHFVLCVIPAVPLIVMITMIKGAHFAVCVITAIPVLMITIIKAVHFVMCVIYSDTCHCGDHCYQNCALCDVCHYSDTWRRATSRLKAL